MVMSMIFERCGQNPLIIPEMVRPWLPGYRVECTMNAGVACYGPETLLLLRVAEKRPQAEPGYLNVPFLNCSRNPPQVEIRTLDMADPRYDFSDPRKVYDREAGNYVYLTSISHLRLARSRDGIHFSVDSQPFIMPDCAAESFGTEDSRITQIGEDYWINYTAVSPDGITTAIATTRDFLQIRKHGVAFVTENRDVTIFPERICGRYYALVRPVPKQIGKAQIWVTESDDLLHWGHYEPLRLPIFPWNDGKTGGGAVPIRTGEGWLILYHGADRRTNRYCMGAALLDPVCPARILAVTENPVLEPLEAYEQAGFYPNVVFSCGAVTRGDTVYMYYGAADRVVGLAFAEISTLLGAMTRIS